MNVTVFLLKHTARRGGLIVAAVVFVMSLAGAGQGCCEARVAADSSSSGAPSPKGALLRSVAYPGWGQLANGKPYKACVIMAVEAYLAGVALTSDRRARDAGRLARAESDDIAAAGLEDRRARYEDRRNAHFWWLGAAILYSMLDAYVDASLADVSKGGVDQPPIILRTQSGDGGGMELGVEVKF